MALTATATFKTTPELKNRMAFLALGEASHRADEAHKQSLEGSSQSILAEQVYRQLGL